MFQQVLLRDIKHHIQHSSWHLHLVQQPWKLLQAGIQEALFGPWVQTEV